MMILLLLMMMMAMTIIPCSTFLFEKLTVIQLVKRISSFYVNRKFIIVFTRTLK